MKTTIVLVALSLLAVGMAATPVSATCTPTPVEQVCATTTIGPVRVCAWAQGAVETVKVCVP